MELSEREIDDLRYLRTELGWNDEDARDVKRSIQATADGAWFYTVLAAARRAGYRYTRETGYLQVQAWCMLESFGDPFGPAGERAAVLAALDARRPA